MKKITIAFVVIVLAVTIFFVIKASFAQKNTQNILAIGSFIILSLTLIVLIGYAYDTNSIARITRDRWAREGVLSTTYSLNITDQQGDRGRTMFQLHNPSSLVVRARVNFNFKVYGEGVSAGGCLYDGNELWLLFPQQTSQGWFEIASL